MIAVIKTGGKQYVVKEKQTLRVEKLQANSQQEKKVVFENVLLVADGKGKTTVGTPTVAKAHVDAQIITDGKAKKIRVVHYKPKTRYKKVYGHRQPYTEVMIEKIVV